MHHDDFHKLAAKYKFTLAMENAICDDYMTEKLWRPLRLGSVPIVFGSHKVKVEINFQMTVYSLNYFFLNQQMNHIYIKTAFYSIFSVSNVQQPKFFPGLSSL